MIWNVFRRKTPALLPRVPAGQVIYAIGDVHGQQDLAEALVDYILKDADDDRDLKVTVVGLGDYIDRGSYSKNVVELLIALEHNSLVQARFLRGNHEAALVDFINGRSDGAMWMEFGGIQTLESYGLNMPSLENDADRDGLRRNLKNAIPDDHMEFLERLGSSISIGDYFFAHAGARPGTPLDQQDEEDLIWIRGDFLKSRRSFEKMVVHGHSPTQSVHRDHRRIGIDTGAYVTGVLSALRLEGDKRRLVQAVRERARQVNIRTEGL